MGCATRSIREIAENDPAMNTTAPLLQIRDLSVSYGPDSGRVAVVRGVSLDIAPGEIVGLVGESGSGKTQLLMSILGLNSRARLRGSIRYHDQELIGLNAARLNAVRGSRIAMIFQDPMTALNPYLRIGRQITEVLRVHRGVGRRAAELAATAMLESVHMPEASQQLRRYPHELSGGMRQRVMIAMALIAEPQVLLADEPTTALDVTVQAQILSLLRELRSRTGIAIVLVTHDIGVIAEIADRVAVMYAGTIVEQAAVEPLFFDPRHPYTEALQHCIPRLDTPVTAELASIPGAPPDPATMQAGCPFAPRCAYRLPVCDREAPALLEAAPGHYKACHYEGTLDKQRGRAA
jgi:oligopeptide transport system ATP-binding protein